MTGRARLARHETIAIAQGLLAIEPLLVGADEDLVSVLRRAGAEPSTRVLGVVDDVGILVGILPIRELVYEVLGRVMPEVLLPSVVDYEGLTRFGHVVEGHTARDAMLPPAVLRETASIVDAFRLMHQRMVSGLYVVDAKGRPTGYVDLLELAMAFVPPAGEQPARS